MKTPHVLKDYSGFTMVEIIVASLVFALAITGLFATISNMNRPSVESFEKVQAAYIGKQIAEGLRRDIDAEIWNETDPKVYNLVEGATYTLNPITRDGVTYTANYTVTPDNSTSGRWVDMHISWQ